MFNLLGEGISIKDRVDEIKKPSNALLKLIQRLFF